MAVDQKNIYVYDDFSFEEPILLVCYNWIALAKNGLSRGQIEEMQPAFSLGEGEN